MFENLREILHKKGMSIKQYTKIFGVEKKRTNKLSGRMEYTYSEFKKDLYIAF